MYPNGRLLDGKGQASERLICILAKPKLDFYENENSRSYQRSHLKFFSHLNFIFLTMINEMSFPSFFNSVQI